ncbi:integrin beta-1-A-like [Physella acuta]|uniref:integrin beta-1-A-like n=1 Tax=Physella acuta TaxID=109671 RepID=UPI0027DCC7D5|nr:integrin beta-1-A-like [Physella acuta]
MGVQSLVALYSTLVFQVYSESSNFSNPCLKAQSCGECIQTSPDCSWCAAEVLDRQTPRCDIYENLRKKCEDKDISNPKSQQQVLKDDAFTSGGAGVPPKQVKPQDLTFQLRPNELVSFNLSFSQQADYPVDLYVLLDLSYGIARQKEAQERLIALGADLPFSLQSITNNFRLGFGTFVDKLLMPYTAWTDQMLQYRCPTRNCSKPHDYKNRMNLMENTQNFAIKMREALEDVSQSMDDAEGGLDGLVQSLACDRIGWRDVSRRIIVYCSNSLFHLAGNGKLGGATRQNDLKCALNNKDEYENEKIFDYPSVSQIALKLREKKANVIFAVMSNVSEHYHRLVSFLDGAVVGELAENSQNIVQLINEKYKELRSRIKFQTENADYVDVIFKSKCAGNILKETNMCENLEIKQTVDFSVTLMVHSDICKGHTGTVEKNVTVKAVGLNEQLLIRLNVTCGCECEQPSKKEPNSQKCNGGKGTFECGVCSCNSGWYGRKCECSETEISSHESLLSCRMSKNDTTTCSGKGECICGECKCFTLAADSAQKYSGPYCECNDYSCPSGPSGLCGGDYKGTCSCGKCRCKEGWSGDDCECTESNETCKTEKGEICNNFGTCKCGKCSCDPQSNMIGPTCEDCPTCPSQCSEYIDCAQCKAHGTGKHNREECDKTCQNVMIVDTLEKENGVRSCEGIDVDACAFYFTYQYKSDNTVLIRAQKTKDCPEKLNLAAIIGGTIAAVVLIPLLILCLIIFLRNRQDAKEYAEFLNEKNKAQWDTGENPIYKESQTTFHNPTFRVT